MNHQTKYVLYESCYITLRSKSSGKVDSTLVIIDPHVHISQGYLFVRVYIKATTTILSSLFTVSGFSHCYSLVTSENCLPFVIVERDIFQTRYVTT